MIKLFLCDDNRLHLEYTAKYISSLPRSSAFEVQTFSAPQELLAKIRVGDVPNIAILDVEMPKIEGIPLAEQINRLCPRRWKRRLLRWSFRTRSHSLSFSSSALCAAFR